jgi:WhiB family redox-sensing transcriptional regulator
VIADALDWRQHARCGGVDPEIHFPAHDADGTAAAKRICRKCPVKSECLAYALEHDEQHGVWGGMTPAERRKHVAYEPPPPAPPVPCPNCGRRLTPWRGLVRRHNWVDEVKGWVRCPGTGMKP